MLQLVIVSNFTLNKQLRIFEPNFPKEGYLWSKQKK